jgi:sterol desaturase/sphingolipid hydroxylase (fatty acid hydroxylase superfamily)
MDHQTIDFQSTKALIVGLSFCFLVAAESLWPYRSPISRVVKNWFCNIPLGAINGLLSGILTTILVVPIALWSGRFGFGIPILRDADHGGAILVSVLALDFVSYIWHRANHKWDFLWRFHAVHHSDTVFDVSTALRFHPGEVLLSVPIRSMVIILLSLPWHGVLVFEIIFTVCNFFEHANLRLPEKIERLIGVFLVTPALHRRHHSRIRDDQKGNFATIFSVWDRIGKTRLWAISEDAIDVGLSPEDHRDRSFWELLVMPFKKTKSSTN